MPGDLLQVPTVYQSAYSILNASNTFLQVFDYILSKELYILPCLLQMLLKWLDCTPPILASPSNEPIKRALHSVKNKNTYQCIKRAFFHAKISAFHQKDCIPSKKQFIFNPKTPCFIETTMFHRKNTLFRQFQQQPRLQLASIHMYINQYMHHCVYKYM